MQPVEPKKRAKASPAGTFVPGDEGPLTVAGSSGIVLPRFLRRPVRRIQRIASGGLRVSRGGIVGSLVLAAAVSGGLYLHQTGKAFEYKAQIASALGIVVSRYEVSGNREVPDTEIVSMVAADVGDTIFGYDVEKARETLKTHAWIADATVSRIYPDTIAIDIREHPPLAIWQAPEGLRIIGFEGKVLADYDGNPRGLPLVVGAGANTAAADMIALMQRFPTISAQTRALIRVGERRWDLEMNGGVSVMLPETGFMEELGRLAELVGEQGLLDRDVVQVDMRMPDRTVVRMSDAGAETYKLLREDQLKHLATMNRERKT